MELLLKRLYFPGGTNGSLLINGQYHCKTIELPWKDNQTGISCIPEGTYNVKRRISAHLGGHLILENVPKRDLILIHKANDAVKELRGCIAPVSKLTGEGKGDASKAAFDPLFLQVCNAIERGEAVHI